MTRKKHSERRRGFGHDRFRVNRSNARVLPFQSYGADEGGGGELVVIDFVELEPTGSPRLPLEPG